MSNEMVGRVARVICDAGSAGSDDCTCNPGTCLLPHFNKAARLAIAAMREDDLRLELAFRKFQTQYVIAADCWQWTGAIDRRDGYGRFYDGSGQTVGAHQFSFKYHKGAVPEGLVLDHSCRNRSCVNPDHLQAVSSAENVLAGVGITAQHARATHCGRGHEFTEANTYVRPDGLRMCRPCQAERDRSYKQRRRAAHVS